MSGETAARKVKEILWNAGVDESISNWQAQMIYRAFREEFTPKSKDGKAP